MALQSVTLTHGNHPVLRDVTFALHAGEVVALMGANGSGKTTLLRSIAGLHPAYRGEITLGDRPISSISVSQIGKQLGLLPQRARTLLFNETVRDEIAFSLKHRNCGNQGVDTLLKEFGLLELAREHPFDLSSGEQERLGLAATMAGDPPLLLLDEPTRGLDAPRKESLAISLRRRALDGAAVVLATHDVELAASVATRVVLLGGGQVLADGSPREVLGNSLVYGTQINKVFGRDLLTVDDVRRSIEADAIRR